MPGQRLRGTDSGSAAVTAALELEIEETWFGILHIRKPQTVYLTSGHRLVRGSRAEQLENLWEVGTYTKTIALEDFRADVFHVFDQRGGA